MKGPNLRGTIERRLLINFRADPDVVAKLLPAPFRPQVVHGFAVSGICLLKLDELRPVGFPRFLGQRSENAAHRIAVEWDSPGGIAQGVYITRRDSDSILNVIAGGRAFPGRHHRAHFTTQQTDREFAVGFHSFDGSASADVRAHIAEQLGESKLFSTLEEASRFFECGSVGYSDGRTTDVLEGMELVTNAWRVEPLNVDHVESSFFEDRDRFPVGSVDLDCALIMRHVPVSWRSSGTIPSAYRSNGHQSNRTLNTDAEGDPNLLSPKHR